MQLAQLPGENLRLSVAKTIEEHRKPPIELRLARREMQEVQIVARAPGLLRYHPATTGRIIVVLQKIPPILQF